MIKKVFSLVILFYTNVFQVTFTVQDPYSPAMAGVEVVLAGNTGLLDLFNAWHTSALNVWIVRHHDALYIFRVFILTFLYFFTVRFQIPVHDVGLLLSGFNFLGLVAGLAAIGGMCVKGYSGAIVQTTFSGIVV